MKGDTQKITSGRWLPGWRKECVDDTLTYVYDTTGNLVEVECYEPSGEYCMGLSLQNVRIETKDGELIAIHTVYRVSKDAYDIHVKDANGKLRVILHHSDVGRAEPNTIEEEWIEE